MPHVVLLGHVHVDEPEEGGALDAQPLRALRRRVQAAGEHVEAEAVQVAGQLVADAGVATWYMRVRFRSIELAALWDLHTCTAVEVAF